MKLSRARAHGVLGFTLIELLVVIAIVAILAVAVIVALNPAQLLRQARDSNRISDMASLRSALQLYLADVQTGVSLGAALTCYASTSSAPTQVGCGARMAGTLPNSSTTAANSPKVDGTGWIPVNFTSISSGSPLGTEPVDAINNSVNFYSYATAASLAFEIDAKMESTKYSNGGTGDVESADGGNNTGVFEVGTASGLAL